MAAVDCFRLEPLRAGETHAMELFLELGGGVMKAATYRGG